MAFPPPLWAGAQLSGTAGSRGELTRTVLSWVSGCLCVRLAAQAGAAGLAPAAVFHGRWRSNRTSPAACVGNRGAGREAALVPPALAGDVYVPSMAKLGLCERNSFIS